MKKLLVLPAIALSLIGTGTAAASVPETHMNKTPEVTEIQLEMAMIQSSCIHHQYY